MRTAGVNSRMDRTRMERSRAGAKLGAIAGLAISSAGCSGPAPAAPKGIVDAPPRGYLPAPEWDAGDRPVTERLSGPLEPPGSGARLVGSHRLSIDGGGPEPVDPALVSPAPGELIAVKYSVRNADISEVLRELVGGYLGRDYVLDPRLTGQLTLEIDQEMTRADLMDLLSALASLQGWVIEQNDGILFVRLADKLARSPVAPVLTASPAFPSEAPVLRVRKVRYAAPDQLAGLLKELMSEGARAVVVGRAMVLADTAAQVSRLSKLIAALDVPSFEGAEIRVYRLASRRPEDAVTVLQAVTAGSGITSGADASVAFIPMPGTDRLMVVARDASLVPLVHEMVREVDQPSGQEQRNRYVYRIQNYQAQALRELLAGFFGDKIEKEPKETDPTRVRLTVDAQNDLLLIYATPADYAEILATLRAVDRPPQQVMVNSIIAEVALTDALQYGVEYFLEVSAKAGELGLTGAAPLPAAAAETGSIFFTGGDGLAVIQALDRESRAEILSQPRLVIQDRGVGSIQVGGEVPTTRASEPAGTQTGGTTGIRQEIEYRETGVILSLEPGINESGDVRLKISQEVTNVVPTNDPNLPAFTTRKVETTVVVPHGKTVLLGGIINNTATMNTGYIPFLGRIPVLGLPFRNVEDRLERTELLLAITPTIINTPGAGAQELSEFLRGAGSVRSALLEYAADLPAGAIGASTLVPPPFLAAPLPEGSAPEAAAAGPTP